MRHWWSFYWVMERPTMARCRGLRKDGERCKREGDFPTGYCWQHADQAPAQEAPTPEPKVTRRQFLGLDREMVTKAGIGGAMGTAIAEFAKALWDACVEQDVYPSGKRILAETARKIREALTIPERLGVEPQERPTPETEPTGTLEASEPTPEPAPTATGMPRQRELIRWETTKRGEHYRITRVWETPIVRIDIHRLNVRAGPGTDYPIVGQLARGRNVAVVGRDTSNEWWRIEFGFPLRAGWILSSSSYVTVLRGSIRQADIHSK